MCQRNEARNGNIRRAFSVSVFVRQGEKVLVIFHHRLQTWLPIGGEMEEGETPLEAAKRELAEETGLSCVFSDLEGTCSGVPAGYLGYEEHDSGSKGLHMNFIFVADSTVDPEVRPNDEFSEYRWVNRAAVESLESPLNVRQFALRAINAKISA